AMSIGDQHEDFLVGRIILGRIDRGVDCSEVLDGVLHLTACGGVPARRLGSGLRQGMAASLAQRGAVLVAFVWGEAGGCRKGSDKQDGGERAHRGLDGGGGEKVAWRGESIPNPSLRLALRLPL